MIREWESLTRQWAETRPAAKANRLFDKCHAIARRLRGSPEGREGIESFAFDANRGVALAACVVALAWDSEIAMDGPKWLVANEGQNSLEAKYAISDYRADRMSFDWWPES